MHNKENLIFEEYCKHDANILAINFYDFDTPIEKNPRIVILCKVVMYNEKGYMTEQYFNFIFIKPSRYSIDIKSFPYIMDKGEFNNPQKIYNWVYPLIYNVVKVNSNPIHSHWEIQFGKMAGFENEEPQKISIYADDLKIEKVNKK